MANRVHKNRELIDVTSYFLTVSNMRCYKTTAVIVRAKYYMTVLKRSSYNMFYYQDFEVFSAEDFIGDVNGVKGN